MLDEEEILPELTPKQKIFCEQYVIDWNGSRAAKAAGYSEKTATAIAAENLTKPNIRAYINAIQKDISKLAGVSALRNVLELKKIAYANLSKFKDDWMTEKNFNELSEDEKACLSEIIHTTKSFEGSTESIVKFKLYDKIKAIETINKMLGFNEPDKFDHTTKGQEIKQTTNFVVSEQETIEELRKLFDDEINEDISKDD